MDTAEHIELQRSIERVRHRIATNCNQCAGAVGLGADGHFACAKNPPIDCVLPKVIKHLHSGLPGSLDVLPTLTPEWIDAHKAVVGPFPEPPPLPDPAPPTPTEE